jgi:hypothetical protein
MLAHPPSFSFHQCWNGSIFYAKHHTQGSECRGTQFSIILQFLKDTGFYSKLEKKLLLNAKKKKKMD